MIGADHGERVGVIFTLHFSILSLYYIAISYWRYCWSELIFRQRELYELWLVRRCKMSLWYGNLQWHDTPDKHFSGSCPENNTYSVFMCWGWGVERGGRGAGGEVWERDGRLLIVMSGLRFSFLFIFGIVILTVIHVNKTATTRWHDLVANELLLLVLKYSCILLTTEWKE